jgi:hypothetical protein
MTKLSPSCFSSKSTKPGCCCMSCSRSCQLAKNRGCTSLGTTNLRARQVPHPQPLSGAVNQTAACACQLHCNLHDVPWLGLTSSGSNRIRWVVRAHVLCRTAVTVTIALLHTAREAHLLMLVNCCAAAGAAAAAGALTGLAAAAAGVAPLLLAACRTKPHRQQHTIRLCQEL